MNRVKKFNDIIVNTTRDILRRVYEYSDPVVICTVGSNKTGASQMKDLDYFVFVRKSPNKDISSLQERISYSLEGFDIDVSVFEISRVASIMEDREEQFCYYMKDALYIAGDKSYFNAIVSISEENYKRGNTVVDGEYKLYISKELKRMYNELRDIKESYPLYYETKLNEYAFVLAKNLLRARGLWVPKDKKVYEEIYRRDLRVYAIFKDLHESLELVHFKIIAGLIMSALSDLT